MTSREGRYDAAERRSLAEVPGLRVRLLGLLEEQTVPWHLHTEITDTFVCMEGPMELHLREPDERVVLEPGQMHAVPPGRPHMVRPPQGRRCRFLVVQGVGTYDYVPRDT